jgi:hypothetical protein
MAVILMLELPGMTPEIYDAINEGIGFPAKVPEGLETHIVGVEETGMRVIDVWESEEQFERFLQEKLLPAMGEIDVQGSVSAPRVVQLPLYDRWSS